MRERERRGCCCISRERQKGRKRGVGGWGGGREKGERDRDTERQSCAAVEEGTEGADEGKHLMLLNQVSRFWCEDCIRRYIYIEREKRFLLHTQR